MKKKKNIKKKGKMSSTTSPVSALKLGGMKQSEDALSFERAGKSAGGNVIVHFRLKANEEVLRDCKLDCIQTIANLKWYLENERGVVAVAFSWRQSMARMRPPLLYRLIHCRSWTTAYDRAALS